MTKEYNKHCLIEHHIFNNYGDYILLDVNTLEVYALDNIEGHIIKELKKYHKENKGINVLIKKYGKLIVNERIKGLLENGILKKEDEKERDAIKNFGQSNEVSNPIKAINISISEDCNLACKYCYVKNGKYHGKTDLMSANIGKKSIDFLIQRSGDLKDLFVVFFGGEPLINFRVLKKVVYYAQDQERKMDKRFHFSITTNGVLLDEEVIEFIREHQISVVISIDGDYLSHNQNRPMSGGGGSYIKVINNLKKLDMEDIKYSARLTVSSLTKKNIAKNFVHLFSLGFKRLHFENALAPEDKIFINDKSDIEDIKKQYVEISKEIAAIITSDIPYDIEMFPLPLKKLDKKEKVFYPCAAGRGNIAVGVNGDIFLCHRFIGNEDFLMGNVIDDIYSNETLRKHIHSIHVDKKRDCKNCWARYICGGGCYAINYEFNKDISQTPKIYCELKKHIIELALIVYASAAQAK